VNSFRVTCIGAVRESTKIVWRQSSLFGDLVLLDPGEKLLCSFVCGESVLLRGERLMMYIRLNKLTGKASQTL
jgi:hypothetical protein